MPRDRFYTLSTCENNVSLNIFLVTRSKAVRPYSISKKKKNNISSYIEYPLTKKTKLTQ